jgi:hypothetical protein
MTPSYEGERVDSRSTDEGHFMQAGDTGTLSCPALQNTLPAVWGGGNIYVFIII